MNNTQLMSLLRTVLQIAGTLVVAHGTLGINGAMWEQISGAVLMLAPIVWSMFAHTDKANLQAAAAVVDPDTGKKVTIVASPAMAAATPDQNNIVSSTDVKVLKNA